MASAFLLLPGEVRNQIYRSLLVDESISIGQYRYRWLKPFAPEHQHGFLPGYVGYNFPSSTEMHVAILRTCRQIYNEAITIFLGENIFWFNGRPTSKSLVGIDAKLEVRKIKLQRSFKRLISRASAHLMLPLLKALKVRRPSFARIQHLGSCLKLHNSADNFTSDRNGIILAHTLWSFGKFLSAPLKTMTLEIDSGKNNFTLEGFAPGSKLMRAMVTLPVQDKITITINDCSPKNVERLMEFTWLLGEAKSWKVSGEMRVHSWTDWNPVSKALVTKKTQTWMWQLCPGKPKEGNSHHWPSNERYSVLYMKGTNGSC